MFVRKKPNKSGSVSVQVVLKHNGRYRVIHTVGCAHSATDIEQMVEQGKKWISEKAGPSLFDSNYDNAVLYDRAMNAISQNQLRLVGPDLVYGTLFDRIGYNKVQTKRNELFRALVVTRLYRPKSKLRTVEYMSRFMHRHYSVDAVYRFLDDLCFRDDRRNGATNKQGYDVKYQVEQVSFEHTKNVMGGEVNVVFYDTTTMFFESREDDIRIPGYSKDGKHSNPQIVFGLLVGTGGNPIGYEIHRGNQYEGTTLIPIIEKMQKRFGLGKPTVIADAGLLNKQNVKELEDGGYRYILGARIKSQNQKLKDRILGLNLQFGQTATIDTDGRKLIITMSASRAKKNAADRERGLKRLRKSFSTGKLTKQHISKRGYNSLLSMEGDIKVVIDEEKIAQAARFDGLKGYYTNSDLPADEIIDNYHYLHMIERAFRFNKTDLDIRPMYHHLINRIEAHICICFTAYTIMLELERILKAAGSDISLHQAMFLAERIYAIDYVNPYDQLPKSTILRTEGDIQTQELLRALGVSI